MQDFNALMLNMRLEEFKREGSKVILPVIAWLYLIETLEVN